MYWNHRVVKVGEGEDTAYVLAEVFYDEATDKPMCWADSALVGDTPEELSEVVSRLAEALKTPVLDGAGMDNMNYDAEETEH